MKKWTSVGIIWVRLCSWGTRCLKKSGMPIAVVLLSFAIIFGVFRALTPWAKQYKGDVEQHLSRLIGQPVVISSMETSWYWFWPVIKLTQVSVLDGPRHGLTFAQLMVGIDLMSSLWHWHLQPGILYIDDVHVTLRQVDQGWSMDGLRQDKQESVLVTEDYLPVLGWLLNQEKIILKHVSLLVHLKDGTLLPVSALNLVMVNHSGRYRVKGEAHLAQTMDTQFKVLADLSLNPNELSQVSGHAYASVRRFLPQQWQFFFKDMPYQVNGGKGDAQVWLDLKKGQATALQTKFDFKRIAWNTAGSTKDQWIQSIKANVAWALTKEGWSLSADHILLRAGNFQWPENALVIQHQKEDYLLYVKALMLEPLKNLGVEWPQSMQPSIKKTSYLEGGLFDTQVVIKKGEIDQFLSRFVALGWRGLGDYPDVTNLSGVVSWRPDRGHLALDGENTTLLLKGLPPVTFEQVNADVRWMGLGNAREVTMDRLILRHPDLVLGAHGVFDGAPAHLQLSAEFSANEGTQWLRYLPNGLLKPKLENWIKHDIKRVDHAIGQLTINGNLADFPFDKRPGDFHLVTQLSGMDLYFHKDWPPLTHLDLLLTVDHRNMDIQVLHASLLEIEATQANLSLNDMGLGHETLLLHGQVDIPAIRLKNYVLATPLRKLFATLKKLGVKGIIGLDLNLDVPLYPERNDVLAQGTITLKDDQLTFRHVLQTVTLDHVCGPLRFDEEGARLSTLTAELQGEPITMEIQSFLKPHAYTSIQVAGDTTIDKLRDIWEMPVLSLMKGPLKLKSILTFTADPDALDHIKLTTSLKGVDIDLPEPFGKKAEDKAPLSVTFDFNPEKAARLRINYDERLSSDLRFVTREHHLVLDQGVFQVGEGHLLWKNQPGLQLVGSLKTFDMKPWRKLWSHWSTDLSTPSMLNQIDGMDLKFDEVILFGASYPHVGFSAKKSEKNDWSFHVDQQDILADLGYQPETHTLSGHFKRLYLPKPKASSPSSLRLKPTDLPNFDLTLDDVKLKAPKSSAGPKDEMDVGQVALKSISTEDHLHLEDFKITTAGYQVVMTGDWSQKDGKDATTLTADVHVTNLAESLKFWHISPVIDSHQGNLQFKGSWPGALNDVSLAKITGSVYVMFQNGIITHLSRETEEKLGLGKLFSILSLQTIPRRLKLDFSDLSNAGYSFDILKGNFTLTRGVMTTNDSYIDGPVAYASMKGDLDVVKRLYDVTLHVSPHITASLPIVATIAGGPIAGMATWVASKIINQGMQQMTGYTYQVTGPWLEPEVHQVTIYRK
ncbi:MAG: YhdP family protein [Legionellales bacterium]|nr:YhdP family protein [Legionellales bacterium]